MNINDKPYTTIWLNDDGWSVEIIDQTKLPFQFETVTLQTLEDAVVAIKDMQVRGAPLIGVTAAYGFCLGLREDASDKCIQEIYDRLYETRPTAVNLRWALDRMKREILPVDEPSRVERAYDLARLIREEDIGLCKNIGENGLKVIQEIARQKPGERINILTHCNAGWLATVDWGTALSPIYHAHNAGLPVHVWVDETRPRNQGASLTASELSWHGIPHTLIADNTGGILMQNGMVDLCIVGSDRTTGTGDVCNKIGTYLKALAAHDNDIPFYAALPYSTIDWTLSDGVREIKIEERSDEEVTHMTGLTKGGRIETVRICPESTSAANYGFDVTPAKYVTGIITERGVCEASFDGLTTLYPEHRETAKERKVA